MGYKGRYVLVCTFNKVSRCRIDARHASNRAKNRASCAYVCRKLSRPLTPLRTRIGKCCGSERVAVRRRTSFCVSKTKSGTNVSRASRPSPRTALRNGVHKLARSMSMSIFERPQSPRNASLSPGLTRLSTPHTVHAHTRSGSWQVSTKRGGSVSVSTSSRVTERQSSRTGKSLLPSCARASGNTRENPEAVSSSTSPARSSPLQGFGSTSATSTPTPASAAASALPTLPLPFLLETNRLPTPPPLPDRGISCRFR